MKQPDAIFARHSESTGNAEHVMKGTADYPLDKHGKSESQKLAIQIKRFKPSVVISSPLQRAKVPAALAAKKAGVKLVIDKGLLPPNLGAMKGEPQRTGESKLQDRFDNHRQEPIARGGDKPGSWVGRARSAVRRVQVRIAKGERPAVVTHSRNLRALPNMLHNKPVTNVTRGGPPPAGIVALRGKQLRRAS